MFLLDHKYYLSKNEEKNKGYLYSTIDFINLVKTNGNRNLHDICKIETQEAIDKYIKLAVLDEELIDPEFQQKKEKKELLKKEILEYFSECTVYNNLYRKYFRYKFSVASLPQLQARFVVLVSALHAVHARGVTPGESAYSLTY